MKESIEDYTFTGYNPKHREQARSLRKNMTSEEKHLWYDFLRNYPLKFYRQRTVDQYIVDFYCSKARLVVEIDGGLHYTIDGLEYDMIRTEVLECYGLSVLRFRNRDISDNFQEVCRIIDDEIQKLLLAKDDVL